MRPDFWRGIELVRWNLGWPFPPREVDRWNIDGPFTPKNLPFPSFGVSGSFGLVFSSVAFSPLLLEVDEGDGRRRVGFCN